MKAINVVYSVLISVKMHIDLTLDFGIAKFFILLD